MEHFCTQSVKKVLFERMYVLICPRLMSESVAIPHPPLRGTFPPGEGISPPNSNFPVCRGKPIRTKEILRFSRK